MRPFLRHFPALLAPLTLLGAVACGPAQPAQAPDGPAPGAVTTPTPPATPPATGTPAPEPPPAETSGNTVTTAQVAAGLEPGVYQLEAYVIELRPCPECPPPLSCKPCLGEFIVVHDQPTAPANGTAPMLRLAPDQIKQFSQGKRYRFELESKSSDATHHVEVLHATPLD